MVDSLGFALSELTDKKESLELELKKLNEQLAPIRTNIMMIRQEVELIDKLIGIKKLDNSSTVEAEIPYTDNHISSEVSSKSNPYTLEKEVEKILDSHKRALHVNEIVESLKDSGVEIPGQGRASNVITRLTRAKNIFVRVKRGTYALRKWDK